jgi:L-rhamnose mutarotase
MQQMQCLSIPLFNWKQNNMTKRYCLTLDLKNDPQLISEYEQHHQQVWPEIVGSIKESGITHMEIYRYQTRLFMIMDVNENFSFEAKTAADAANEKVQEWETLMWNYQQALPGAKPGEKWMLMEQIFDLD